MDQLTIIQPDDWHLHLRDEGALATTVPAAARCFGRGIVMPNLVPPVRNVAAATAYRERVLAARPEKSEWQPLMVLYLTDNTSADDIRAAHACAFVHACKYYPAGATTNSDSGVTDLERLDEVFETMQELGVVLQMHGEVTDPDIDIFDREAVFIDRHLVRIREKFPALKMVLEHITTEQGATFVRHSEGPLAASITPQHLLYNRNDMLVGGIRPHLFCLPILKRNRHQTALIEAAIELYAEAFDRAGALHQLEGFASRYGADFYNLAYNRRKITLNRDPWTVPERIDYDGGELIPLAAGQALNWRLQN